MEMEIEKGRSKAVRSAEKLVEKAMASRDVSHDAAHAFRVELAALLHDIGDYKYMKNSVEDMIIVESFLDEEGLEDSKKEKILSIIKGMGLKNEVSQTSPIKFPAEFGVVQDADRLDAIGAIGIARCFTYGGSVNQILHDPNIPPQQNLLKEKYMNKDESRYQ